LVTLAVVETGSCKPNDDSRTHTDYIEQQLELYRDMRDGKY